MREKLFVCAQEKFCVRLQKITDKPNQNQHIGGQRRKIVYDSYLQKLDSFVALGGHAIFRKVFCKILL